MDVDLLVELGCQAEGLGAGPCVRHCRLGRLLHDVAQGPRESEVPVPGQDGDFHVQDLSAGGGPGEAVGDAHPFGLLVAVRRLVGWGAKEFPQVGGVHPVNLFASVGHLAGELAGDPGEAAVQFPHAGLPGVAPDDLAHGLRGHGHRTSDPVGLRLARPEEATSDLPLLGVQVPREADHLHTVPEGLGDPLECVGRGDEQDIRQVVLQLQVVVRERPVLFGIQDFQKRRPGIAVEVSGQLVHLVQEKDRVGGAAAAHPLDDPSGKGAHISAAVSPDFSLVPDTPQAHAHELPSQGVADATSQGRLAHAGGANQAEDGAAHLPDQRKDRDVVQDPLLHLGQPEVLRVQDGGRVGHVEVVR